MIKIVLCLVLSVSFVFSETIDYLLSEYERASDNSLQTVDEKIGHVINYSQQEIRLMQYRTLNDILRELPVFNVNSNRFGLSTPSLVGTKTTTSGFFRFFINDHELSSGYDQSTLLSWGDLPLDFIDHVEIYYGESSFSFGNETGMYYIRIYTKEPEKENASAINLGINSQKAYLQSFTQSQTFENGWKYLMFVNQSRIFRESDYKNQTLNANGIRRYLFADASNETSRISAAYTDFSSNNYAGLSIDAIPDSGRMRSKDFFVDVTHFFLDDRSIKANLSFDANNREYYEENAQGLWLVPVLDFTQLGLTIPIAFDEELEVFKTNAFLSKTFTSEENTFLTAFNVQHKSYDVNTRKTINMLHQTTDVGAYNDFDTETIGSLIVQDSYRLNDEIILVANAKSDRHRRDGFMEDSTDSLYRIGAIYTPTDYLGLKSFYTKTAIAPTFYTIDYAAFFDKELQSQIYRFYTLEAALTFGDSKVNVTYDHVAIDDFIYYDPTVGFLNVDHTIHTEGLIFDYEYALSRNDKLHLNYYTSTLSETINNSTKGGYIKYMGSYQKWDYFTSLIYKNAYRYETINVPASYNVSLGATYHLTKDLSYSVKVNNILDKSTRSLYQENVNGSFTLEDDNDRSIFFSLQWIF